MSLQFLPQTRLPLDVERETFEWTAIAYPRSIPALLRVASRVRAWVEPYLYRAVKVAPHPPYTLIAQDILHPTPNSKSHRFYRDAVRHLYIQDAPPAEVLQVCTRLQTIANFGLARELIPFLARMKDLRQLSLSLRELFDGAPSSCHPKPSHIFRTITHLDLHDIIDDSEDSSILQILPTLPVLTHLCLCDQVPPVRKLLTECKRLRILVNPWDKLNAERGRELARNPPTRDARFVVTVYENINGEWEAYVRGWTIWAAADDFVEKKRRGEIPKSCYLMDYWVPEAFSEMEA
ncbi:hypothetical protein FB45DRAFT_1034385 [Roridomyces roridus]|uniref:Uncharacterized protein n=1 Tax=Roridomyces roridus TaxID=1738132 RepID=A0AAD7FD83_9AGAR|nr:hypothetical protein FB45DRAFT_1034385 [Roridomyces roridus]